MSETKSSIASDIIRKINIVNSQLSSLKKPKKAYCYPKGSLAYPSVAMVKYERKREHLRLIKLLLQMELSNAIGGVINMKHTL